MIDLRDIKQVLAFHKAGQRLAIAMCFFTFWSGLNSLIFPVSQGNLTGPSKKGAERPGMLHDISANSLIPLQAGDSYFGIFSSQRHLPS